MVNPLAAEKKVQEVSVLCSIQCVLSHLSQANQKYFSATAEFRSAKNQKEPLITATVPLSVEEMLD